jgi:HSP20 family protein
MSDWFSGRRGSGVMPTLDSLQSELSRVLNDFGFAPPGTPGAVTTQPRVDVIATERGGLEVHAELPGVEERDIDLSVDGNLLVLRGERRAEREESRRNYRVRERSFGAFSRSIALPFEPDPKDIDAEFRNGVLTVRIERPQPNQQRGAKVQIRTAGGSGASQGGGASGAGAASGATGGGSAPQGGASGMLNEGGSTDQSRNGGMMSEGS